jgi:hypothetical protein
MKTEIVVGYTFKVSRNGRGGPEQIAESYLDLLEAWHEKMGIELNDVFVEGTDTELTLGEIISGVEHQFVTVGVAYDKDGDITSLRHLDCVYGRHADYQFDSVDKRDLGNAVCDGCNVRLDK